MGNYDDIIHLPHHVSPTRSHMSMSDRAAQFSPFAALTGYEAAITETGRLTDSRIELEDYSRAILDRKLQYLSELAWQHPEVTITYFVPDDRKSGGSYAELTGRLKKIDPYTRTITMMDGRRISLSEITDIENDRLSEII